MAGSSDIDPGQLGRLVDSLPAIDRLREIAEGRPPTSSAASSVTSCWGAM
jgi:hypothetical protein